MAKPKASILDEIRRDIPPKRGAWLSELKPDVLASLKQAKSAYNKGTLPTVTAQSLAKFLVDRFKLSCSVAALRQWISS